MAHRRLRRDEYTVGWICALPIELAAAQEMLDEEHEDLDRNENDYNLYSLGRIGDHNVVVICLPAGLMGNNPAAAVATQMRSTFGSMRFGLMVGIGGGVPSTEADIRLGDVVVSQPHQGYGGIVQYDFGRAAPGGFRRTGFLNSPPPMLLGAVAKVRANHLRRRSRLSEYVSRLSRLPQFTRQAAGPDVLFEATYNHEDGPTCQSCSPNMQVDRPARENEEPLVHYGTIASGNQVMRDAAERDRVSAEFGGVLCFEMEAAGLMNTFPCLTIRGICDYADSHKNKTWQAYAAGTAAAYAKEVLSVIPPVEVAKANSLHETLERNKILSWISNIPYESHHNTIAAKRLRGTCSWLLQRQEYQDWINSAASEIFWLHGIPGSGKTILASLVIDQLISTNNLAVYFYCQFNDKQTLTAKAILACFLRQLSNAAPQLSLPSPIREVYFKRMLSGFASDELTFEETTNLLDHLLNSCGPVTFVLDALDECSESERIRILSELQRLTNAAGESAMKVFISSRAYIDIAPKLSAGPSVCVNGIANFQDISLFVHDNVDALQNRSHLHWVRSKDLRDEIKTLLQGSANGMFLWVKLQLDTICTIRWEPEVRRKLKELPLGLAKTYEDIKERIKDLDSISIILAEEAFLWALHSQRPLSPEELLQAMKIGKQRHHFEECPFTLQDVLEYCQNLLVHDNTLNIVRPIHSSVQTFLEADYKDVSGIHASIVGSCLRYLSISPFEEATKSTISILEESHQDPVSHWTEEIESRDGLGSFLKAFVIWIQERRVKMRFILAEYPFLEYSGTYWSIHAELGGMTTDLSPFLWLFDESSPKLQQWIALNGKLTGYQLSAMDQGPGGLDQNAITDLESMALEHRVGIPHILSRIGLPNILSTALRHVPLATGDAFFVAASAGRIAVVKHLLGSLTTRAISQKSFLLSLDGAIKNGHSEIVGELFKHSHACLEEKLIHGAVLTSLILSCMTGDDYIAAVALDRVDLRQGYFSHDQVKSIFNDVTERRQGKVGAFQNINMDDIAEILERLSIKHWTPFMIASVFGNSQIIFLLTERTGPRPTPSEIECALLIALSNQDIKTMKAILQTSSGIFDEANIMAMACFYGSRELIQLLLEKGVDINTDLKGSTPLGIALHQGHEDLVIFLKDKGADDSIAGGATPAAGMAD